MPQDHRRTRYLWICSIVTAISAIVSAGFSLLALRGGGAGDLFAMYAASRSVALLVVLLLVIWFRSRGGVAALALTMALVQMVDAEVGLRTHHPSKTYGPLLLAIAGFVSVGYLLRISDRGFRRNKPN